MIKGPAARVALAQEIERLGQKATQEQLTDGGRYFGETFDNLTQCRHNEIGEYQNAADGELIEALWNGRAFFLEAVRLASESDWQPIATAPEGNEREGPFFDVTWAGENHRYLPIPARAVDCYRSGGIIARKHGYPAMLTLFNPQPTHWRPAPAPAPLIDDGQTA